MWEWEKSHSYIFMKNLLTSIILASSIGIQNVTYNSIYSKNEYKNFNNVQDQLTYTDEILDQHQQYKTIQYNPALFGSNFNIEARGIVYINEDKAYDHYEYKQLILLKINNPTNLDLERILYTVNPSIWNSDKMINQDTPEEFKLCYLISLTTAQTNFIEGANYTTYTDINNVYTSIYENMVDVMNFSQSGLAQTDHVYAVIDLEIEYQDNLIGYNGAFMYTMQIPITTIEEEFTYEVPDVAGYEVVDIPGMMFTILGMPFAWISTAFNFTIFEGTPYAINISAILMAIVIGLIAIYIAKKIIK